MHPFRSLRRALLSATLLAISTACDDPSRLVGPPVAESGIDAVQIQTLACTAHVRSGAVVCGDAEGASEPADGLSRIVLNPTGRWVHIELGPSSYADETLTFDATVQNLIAQT